MPMNTDKPDAVELLPCPYCGGTANLHNDESEFWYVSCRECITQTTHFYNGRDIVIERWNTRDTAENDRLKQEVEAANDLQATLIKNACTDEYCKDEEDNNLAAEYGIPHDSTTCACPCHEMEDAISVALEGDSK